MIDEDATFEQFGYKSTDLKPHSHKKIVAVCDECGKVRVLRKDIYRDLCYLCVTQTEEYQIHLKEMSEANKGRVHTEETRKKMSEARTGMVFTEEHRKNLSESQRGRLFSEETLQKMSEAHSNMSEEWRRKISATKQQIPYDEWENFAKESPYCPKFNQACRESNREKYDRKCFICGKHESNNITKTGKQKRLSVHHIDGDKMQGCNGHRWRLIPTCIEHHNPIHSDLWMCRIIYLLENVYST